MSERLSDPEHVCSWSRSAEGWLLFITPAVIAVGEMKRGGALRPQLTDRFTGRPYRDGGAAVDADLVKAIAAFDALDLPGACAWLTVARALLAHTRNRPGDSAAVTQHLAHAAVFHARAPRREGRGSYPDPARTLQELAEYRSLTREVSFFSDSINRIQLTHWVSAVMYDIAARHDDPAAFGDTLQQQPMWWALPFFYPEWFGGVKRPEPPPGEWRTHPYV